jgi:hypothetical protein
MLPPNRFRLWASLSLFNLPPRASCRFNPGLERMSKQALRSGFDPTVETFLKLVFGRQSEILIKGWVFPQGARFTFHSLSRGRLRGRSGPLGPGGLVFPNRFIGRADLRSATVAFVSAFAACSSVTMATANWYG